MNSLIGPTIILGVLVFLIPLFFIILPIITGIEIKLGSAPEIKCVLENYVESSHPNMNTEIVYRERTKVCDVEKITSGGFLWAYHYSYDFYKKYNKINEYIVPICNNQNATAITQQAGLQHVLYKDIAVFDNKTMNFLCSDGSFAKEIKQDDDL